MNEKTKTRAPQLRELAARLDKLEAKFASAAKGGAHKNQEDVTPQLCALPQVAERTFTSEVSPHRAGLIRYIGKKWVNGTKLRYTFFGSEPWSGENDQKDLVREGFGVWEDLGIGLAFEEVAEISEAEVRIGFLQGDGAWSFVGRDIIDIPGQYERTMNFGWDLTADPRGVDVPVHEIGHTLGFPHEHQNPFAGIVWDEEAVYDYFGGPPNNWDRPTTFHNVLKKISRNQVEGTKWDPDSIMEYAFPAGLIEKPTEYQDGLRPAGGLSDQDVEEVLDFYPPLDDGSHTKLEPFQSLSLSLAPAEQVNFHIAPSETRTYTMQTFGNSDTLMVLFEDENDDLQYVDGDDDSGTSENSRLAVRLHRGGRYVLRIRMFCRHGSGESAVMLW